MVCIKLHFCNSPRSPLVFKGTQQQSLKPHCSGNLTLPRCIQPSIYCSAFLQNLGGKSSAPLFGALPSPPGWSTSKRCSLFSPCPAFPSQRGSGSPKGWRALCSPGPAVPIPFSRSPAPVPVLPRAPGAAPPARLAPARSSTAAGGHINGTQVCTHQAGSPNKGSGRAALQSRRLLPLWTWICSGMLLLVQDCSFHTPSRARPRVLAGVDARPVQLLYKNKVFLLPGC